MKKAPRNFRVVVRLWGIQAQFIVGIEHTAMYQCRPADPYSGFKRSTHIKMQRWSSEGGIGPQGTCGRVKDPCKDPEIYLEVNTYDLICHIGKVTTQ